MRYCLFILRASWGCICIFPVGTGGYQGEAAGTEDESDRLSGKSPVRQDPGDGAGLRETVRSTEAPRQADCRADADPGQGSAAAGDGSGGRKRGVSAEHAIPGKTEDRGMSQQDESSSVTEEELQASIVF